MNDYHKILFNLKKNIPPNLPSFELTNWFETGKYFNYKGHQIFYQEAGTGEILLLIHGFPTASWDWYRIWDGLSEKFHLIAPDMIGFGFSDKPRNYHYCIMDQADLHEVMLEKMGIEKAHILAHDYGDTVSQELLARHLDRQGNFIQALDIQSLTLLNGGIFPEMHRPRTIQNLLASPLGGLLTYFMGQSKLEKTFHDIFGKNTQPTQKEMDEFWALVDFKGGKHRFPQLIKYMEERRQHRNRWVGALQKTKVPLMHINGTDDPISGRHAGEYFVQTVPQAAVHFLEGIGHYPQVEAPSEVLKYFLHQNG